MIALHPLRLLAGATLFAAFGCAAQTAGADAASAGGVAPAANDPAGTSLWTAGLFMVAGSHPAYPGADHRVQNARVLPFITYRGPVLRVEGGSAGLRTLRTPRYELDFSAAGSFGSGGSDVKARAGMPSIGTLAEIGPSLRINLGDLDRGRDRTPLRLALPLRAVFDVSRDFDHSGVSFAPRLSYSLPLTPEWRLTTYAELLAGDRQLANLFYGVDPVYATGSRPAYQAKAGLIATSLGASVSRALGAAKEWRIGAFAGLQSVAGAANEDSPLVGRKLDGRVGITLSWTAYRSETGGVE
jgi:MipA family protein